MDAEAKWFLEKGLSLSGKIIDLRREFHRYPELAFQEKRTASRVAEVLDDLGLEVHSGIGGTGVVARLRGDLKGPVRGLRSDMDALPIQEETHLPYASLHDGIMHACAHDGHMAMLLGAAAILKERKEHLMGDVIFIFQPAEEGFGGAKKMIQEGLLKRFPMDFLFGHHLMPLLFPSKSVVLRKGIFTANSDRFFMEIQGMGGHASMPNLLKDPLPALGQMIGGINTIISRHMDPFEHAVISIGKVHAGTSENIIPHRASLSGSVRTFRKEDQEMIRARLEDLCKGLGQTHGVEISCDYQYNYPSLLNNPDVTEKALALGEAFSAKVIEKENPFMGSEDFAFYSRELPSCFIMLGAEGTAGLHHPAMTFDEAVLPWGASWQAYLAFHS